MPSSRGDGSDNEGGEGLAMQELSLLKYFDAVQQPAIIFRANQSLSPESLEVAYVNAVFLDSIGDTPPAEDKEFSLESPRNERRNRVPHNFLTKLEAHCISPSAHDFVQWANSVANDPKAAHQLKTRFKGLTLPKDGGNIPERVPQFVDVEWNALVLENKYIVLTGRRIGTVQFSPTPGTPESASDVPDQRPSDADEVQVPKSSSNLASSSSSSRYRAAVSRMSSSTTTTTTVSDRPRINSFKEAEESENETYQWQHTERVKNLLFF